MRKSILKTIEAVRPFVPVEQLKCMVDGLKGEERAYFREKIRELEQVVKTMPETYAQDGLGTEAVVHLHYFYGDCDWHITERDVDADGEGQQQAFGQANLGYGPELGYISIAELVRQRAVNLDLHWEPKTLEQVNAKPEPKQEAKPPAETPAYTVAQIVDVVAYVENKPQGLLH